MSYYYIIYIPYIYVYLIILMCYPNKLKLQYEGALKYLGESVIGLKFGYGIDQMVHA